MGTCFVIQPFDHGAFDKRYEDVFVPAISEAGLEPYRVDRDPSVSIPISDIESGIRSSDVCLADITTDNPNVWFELGFAFASQKEVVLVCSDKRQLKFPFDVQHRSIITYATDSSRDFDSLKKQITERIIAILKKNERLGRVTVISLIAEVEGLSQNEMVALVAMGQNLDSPNDFVAIGIIRQDMEKAGFTKIATTLGLTGLLRKDMIEMEQREGSDFNEHYTYTVYRPKEKGMNWLLLNQDQFVLRENKNDQGVSLPF